MTWRCFGRQRPGDWATSLTLALMYRDVRHMSRFHRARGQTALFLIQMGSACHMACRITSSFDPDGMSGPKAPRPSKLQYLTPDGRDVPYLPNSLYVWVHTLGTYSVPDTGDRCHNPSLTKDDRPCMCSAWQQSFAFDFIIVSSIKPPPSTPTSNVSNQQPRAHEPTRTPIFHCDCYILI